MPRFGRCIPRNETCYPLYRRPGGLQDRSRRVWRTENLLSLPGFEFRTVQRIASRYTDYAIPLPPMMFDMRFDFLFEDMEII
jgi:hypothetical protein